MKMFSVTMGPSIYDPTDFCPIQLFQDDCDKPTYIAVINWPVRLAIWVLRRYVNRVLEGKRP